MTVPSQTNKDQQAGNGVSTVFTVPFRILAATHLEVLATIAGATTTLVLTTDYAVSGVGNPNTTVTFVVPPAIGTMITFLRNVPKTQETDYVPNDPFPAQSHENALDKLTMIVQQQQERIDASLSLAPETPPGVSASLPPPASLNLIGWDAFATSLRNFTAGDIGTTLAFSNFIADKFTAAPGQTVFPLTADPGALANLDVSIDGVTQVPGVDYDYLGTALTFAVPLVGGESVLARYGTALPSGITSAAAVQFQQAGIGTVMRTMQDKARDAVSMLDWFNAAQIAQVRARGAALDLSVPMQAAINDMAANGGGVIYLPRGTYRCNVVLKDGVALVGLHPSFGYLPSGTSNGVILLQAAAGFVVDTPVTGITTCGVSGINFQGLGAGTAGGGVRFRDVSWGFVKGCQFNNFADQGILKEAGNACVFEDILTTNVLLNRVRSARNGCIEVTSGADDFLHRIEANPSLTTVTDANLRVCGIAYTGANAFMQSCIGEFADIGIYMVGTGLNRVSLCRADLNQGHGFVIDCGQSQFTSCLALRNGQATHNTYDQWQINGTGNQFGECRAVSDSANRPKYGFNDTVNNGTHNAKNIYTNPRSTGAATANYITVDFAGSAFTFPSAPRIRATSLDTTPSVLETSLLSLNNAGATTITNFDDGLSGQVIEVYVEDANTTLANGSGISLQGGVNMPLRQGGTYRFFRDGANWRWMDERHRDVAKADNGDASATLTAITSERIQIWNTPLTATRSAGLSGAAARSGDTFRIVRTAAATGASPLNVGTGPLKALAVGQWCEVTYDGAAWMLSAFGSL